MMNRIKAILRKLRDFYGAHPIRRTIVTIVLAVVLVAGIYFLPALGLRAAEVPAVEILHTEKGEEIPVGGTVTVASADGRTLLLDTKEMILELKDDATGASWRTALDGAKEGKDKALLQITFLGNDNTLTTWNTYDNCVAFGTYQLFAIENGVRIEMDVNEGESTEFYEYLPQRLPTARYEEFLLPALDKCLEDGEITEDVYKRYQRVLTSMYKKNNAENCYVLTTSGAPSISAASQLIALTKLVGYDRDMLIEDCAAYGAVPEFHEPAQFDIALEAIIDGGDLKVRLPGDEMITGNDFYQLYRLAVLPSLGAENYDKERDGYFLVPDGAGALMRFNTYAATVPEYVRPFLDNDYYSDYYYLSEYGQELMTPVFGILAGGDTPTQALMGIIEGGVETANLHVSLASPSGSGTNRAYVSFDVMDYTRVKIYGAYSDNAATYLSSSGHIAADYALRFRPYPKGATYFDLATDYRDYLARQTGTEIKAPEGPETYLEAMGAVTLTRRFLGIPYDSIASMTTYDDLLAMAEELPADGVTIQYDGGYNGGYLSGLNDGARLVSQNGSGASLETLNQALADKGIDLYWQVNLSRVYKSGRSYIPYLHALRDFSNEAAEIYSYSKATYKLNGAWDPIRPYTRVSPKYLPYLAERFAADAGAGAKVALGDLAHDLFADYRYRAVIDPVEARLLARQALEKLDGPKSLRDPAADLAPLGEWAVDVSRESSGYASFYVTVPFRQLCLRGLTKIAGEDVNLSSKPLSYYLLQAAELGTSVKFTVTGQNPYVLKGSHFEYLYAVYYPDWRSEILEAAEATAALRADIGGREIENHRMLQKDVFETTYAGGVRVIANYSADPYDCEDGTAPAGGWLLIKEGGSL